MALHILTTILWAFSFSLIGEYLAGYVDKLFLGVDARWTGGAGLSAFSAREGLSSDNPWAVYAGRGDAARRDVSVELSGLSVPYCLRMIAWCMLGNPQKLPTTGLQWVILAWLGVVGSGVGYFMWNYGAT